MNTWPATASVVQAEGSRLAKRLYGNLVKAEVELERRSTILQRSSHGAAYDAAFDRFMGAFDARDEWQ